MRTQTDERDPCVWCDGPLSPEPPHNCPACRAERWLGHTDTRKTTPADATPLAEAAVALWNLGGEPLFHACWPLTHQHEPDDATYCHGYRNDVYDALADGTPLPIPVVTYNENGPIYRTNYTACNVRDKQHFVDNGGDPAEWIDVTNKSVAARQAAVPAA